MSENKTYTINAAPALTWNWLKSNNDVITADFSDFDVIPVKAVYDSLPAGFSEEAVSISKESFGSGIYNIPDKKYGDSPKSAQNARITTAAKETSEFISKLLENAKENSQDFVISGNSAEPLILRFNSDSLEKSIAIQNIRAKSNCNGTIIFLYEGNSDFQFIQTRIIAEENAQVHLIKVQLLGKTSNQLDDTQVFVSDNGSVKFTQIELGGKHVDSGLHASLKGYKSRFSSNVAYLCKDNQYYDFNHIVYHFGQKSECDMQVNGTICDDAHKAYRGTIDFKNGCCGSKGNEMEETLILSPKAVNKSLPVILCDEEDVEGEHGATIGRLSSDILFYMQSRGIDEKAAEQIMSKAKIQATADLIPDQEIINKILSFLEK